MHRCGWAYDTNFRLWCIMGAIFLLASFLSPRWYVTSLLSGQGDVQSKPVGSHYPVTSSHHNTLSPRPVIRIRDFPQTRIHSWKNGMLFPEEMFRHYTIYISRKWYPFERLKAWNNNWMTPGDASDKVQFFLSFRKNYIGTNVLKYVNYPKKVENYNSANIF